MDDCEVNDVVLGKMLWLAEVIDCASESGLSGFVAMIYSRESCGSTLSLPGLR